MASVILRVVFPYTLFAGLWILLSDALLMGVLSPDAVPVLWWSVAKGLAFVTVTGLLLLLLLRVELRKRAGEVSARHESTARMQEAQQNYETLFREMLDGCALHEIICDPAGKPVNYRFLSVNPAFERMTGLKAEAVIGRTVLEVLPGIEPYWIETYGRVALTGEPASFESEARELGKWFEVSTFRPAPRRFACIFTDITERRRVEQEREALHVQLNQARRMESVGRLAGGVAHDFNNLLMGLMGSVELCRDEVPANRKALAYLDEIMQGARRSAELTRQLLAFARRQPITPMLLDVNETVGAMLKLLRRMIGEDIRLVWRPGAGLWTVRMDPGQIDQLLANLCVNARDAIGSVGCITIETANKVIDQDFCQDDAEAVPGRYVMLSVRDDGCGMEPEVLEHIFEPFFTTKEVGQGTGLGLATVHGIVKQNRGAIRVDSTAGRGTTFSIYLPQAENGERSVEAAAGDDRARGTETVLLVEDERTVRVTATLFLEKLGYTVLVADSPAEALRWSGSHAGPIDLLVTDVVMPGMSGSDLAAALAEKHPGLKCLYISGYTVEEIRRRCLLAAEVAFLTKPFSRDAMARKVREVLDMGAEGPGGRSGADHG